MRWLSEVEGRSGVLFKDRERTVRAPGQCAPLRERCNVLSWGIYARQCPRGTVWSS